MRQLRLGLPAESADPLEHAHAILAELAADTAWLRDLSPAELQGVIKAAEECQRISHAIYIDSLLGIGQMLPA